MILAQNNQYYHPLGSMNTNSQFNNHLRTPSSHSNSQALQQVPDLMPSQSSWLSLGQPQPQPQPQQQQQQQHVPRTANRLGHQRESSLSSLGSNGPASPFNPTTSNPQIAVTDSGQEAFHDLAGGENYSYQLGKPMSEGLYAGNGAGTMPVDGLPNMAAPHRSRQDGSLGLPTELSTAGSSTSRSHPVSVSSSAAGGDSPATPSLHEPEEDGRRRKNGFQHGTTGTHNGVPKLDRTMTDIYSDELYAPGLSFTSASPPHSQLAMSPSNELFAQRLQAANSQHMTAVQSPVSNMSREKSPFRTDSPFSSTLQDFSQSGLGQMRLPTAQQQRETKKADCDAREIQTHEARNNVQQQGTPSTISPKDAILEFNDADDGTNLPLFPQQEAGGFGIDQMGNHGLVGSKDISHQPMPSFQPMSSIPNNFNFSMPSSLQLPQQYPFVARPRQQQLTPAASTFSRMSSADTSLSEISEGSTKRPARTAADGGTYTCTYHGCTLRFETPMQLQKHKREGHRQANALSSMRPEPAMTSVPNGTPESLLNTQAGPHRCDRINPSTGKPCSTVFSRPYDLTRHEDTIHNARKRKVRCNLCTEEKTFSRADALTRHYRVCHPDVEFPGKHRRRGTGVA